MGELEPWFDETLVRTIWHRLGEKVQVKMIFDDELQGYEPGITYTRAAVYN